MNLIKHSSDNVNNTQQRLYKNYGKSPTHQKVYAMSIKASGKKCPYCMAHFQWHSKCLLVGENGMQYPHDQVGGIFK